MPVDKNNDAPQKDKIDKDIPSKASLDADQSIRKESSASLSMDIEPITTSHNNYSDIIGTGKHAKTNIIWYVISSILVIFSCICISLFVLVLYNYKISEVSQSIKDIWSVFTPIITLSLGYLFGKKTNSTKT